MSLFFGLRHFVALAWTAGSMTPGQDQGKAEIGSDELGGGAGPIRLGRMDFSRI
jgi:hypothetical protein